MNTAHEAALQYVEGRNARLEAMAISDEKIAAKFDLCAVTVGSICRGMPSRVPEEDQALIRSLKQEQQRLRKIHKDRLLPLLAHRFQVRQSDIKAELQKMGVNVA